MGQLLHGSATTTEAVRRAIQLRQESVRALARRYGINPTPVQKWRKHSHAADAPIGPKAPRSSVLTSEEEAIIVAFRRHTLLPLDESLYALQPSIRFFRTRISVRFVARNPFNSATSTHGFLRFREGVIYLERRVRLP